MNWHLLVGLGFLLTVFGGLAIGSAYQYYKEQERNQERERAAWRSSFMGEVQGRK